MKRKAMCLLFGVVYWTVAIVLCVVVGLVLA